MKRRWQEQGTGEYASCGSCGCDTLERDTIDQNHQELGQSCMHALSDNLSLFLILRAALHQMFLACARFIMQGQNSYELVFMDCLWAVRRRYPSRTTAYDVISFCNTEGGAGGSFLCSSPCVSSEPTLAVL